MTLKVVGISKNFGSTKVLQNISFEFPENQICAIVGSSGSGKSTLLKIFGLLLGPDSGSVFFNGTNTCQISQDQRSELRLKGIGFVFQEHNLIPHLSVLDNIVITALMAKTPKKDAAMKAMELLERFKMVDKASSIAKTLSGGQEQRASLARALINKPQMIIADEPTAALDMVNKHIFLDLITELNQTHGQNFLLVTHDQAVALQAHQIMRLENGQLIQTK